MKKPILPDVMTLSEAARFLRICAHTLSKYAREGKIPGQRIGREWRFLRSELENYLRKGHVSTAA